jgi:hypothetical protein
MNGRAMFAFVIPLDGTPVDPGFGGGLPAYGGGHPDQGLPGYGHPGHRLPWGPGHPDQGLPGQGGHPGNALPMPPVRPSQPITLPPNVWPPQLPSRPDLPDNSLPPEAANKPIVIPPDPDLGIEQPIFLPPLPQGVALLIALPYAQPKGDTPVNTRPAILVQQGKRPVLVYVSAGATPK